MTGDGNLLTVREGVTDLVNFSISAQPLREANVLTTTIGITTGSPVDTSYLDEKTVYMIIEGPAAVTATVVIESSPDLSNWITDFTFVKGSNTGLPSTFISAIPINNHVPFMRTIVKEFTSSAVTDNATATVYITGGK